MANKSKIEWTEVTWNPSTGCKKISAGCKYCYAENWAKMLQKRGINQYSEGFQFRLAPNRLSLPYKWKTPKIVFVNSMSDLFYEDMPLRYLKEIFNVMNQTPQHIYQILTKRIENLEFYASKLKWTDNIWLGVSVENNKTAFRIDTLKETPAKLKFISFEPLLENITRINLEGIDWVIVGGESGGKARIMDLNWVRNIQNYCRDLNIPFFFKQWGKREFNPDVNDPTLKNTHSLYARGGCMIDRKIFREFPKNK